MELLKRIKDRAPEYDSIYEDLITRFTVAQGGRAGVTKDSAAWEQGKFFLFKYEIYMYATILGLKTNYRIPINSDAKKDKFIEIKSWQPSELADYIIMSIFAKSDIDFNELEMKDDKEVEKSILSFRKLMEEFANGGLDIIRSKFEEDPSFFNNENCFLDLLDNAK